MEPDKRKFLFLYLKTGGGHLAPAKSISEYLEKHRSEKIETVLYDGFENSKKIVKMVVVDGYRVLQSKAKWIYEFIYAIHKIKIVSIAASWLVSNFIEKHLEEEIESVKPDKIIIFHFFMIEPTYKILKKKKINIPVITVVTDPFTAHPLWFINKKQNFILYSEKLKTKCINNGIEPTNIKVFPFPLHEKYSSMLSQEQKKKIKSELGFDKGKILLILGGADGIPKGIPILKSLCREPVNYKIIIVCGKNKTLFKNAAKLKQSNNYDFIKIFEYASNIYELLSISDAVITKCGASTIMEILITKKIPIVNSYIWEQEKGNVEFLVANKLGFYENDINNLPFLVQRIFLIDGATPALNQIRIENGTPVISDYLLN